LPRPSPDNLKTVLSTVTGQIVQKLEPKIIQWNSAHMTKNGAFSAIVNLCTIDQLHQWYTIQTYAAEAKQFYWASSITVPKKHHSIIPFKGFCSTSIWINCRWLVTPKHLRPWRTSPTRSSCLTPSPTTRSYRVTSSSRTLTLSKSHSKRIQNCILSTEPDIESYAACREILK